MSIRFPQTITLRRESSIHQAAKRLQLRRISGSIADFLEQNRLQLAMYSVEKEGDTLYISSVDGENMDRLTPFKDDMLKHLNTNGFDLRDVFLEKKI